VLAHAGADVLLTVPADDPAAIQQFHGAVAVAYVRGHAAAIQVSAGQL
jgi:hypothetical protein